jgi:hypothetical protein
VTNVHSFARTVGDVLAHQNRVRTHDAVAEPRSAISDGTMPFPSRLIPQPLTGTSARPGNRDPRAGALDQLGCQTGRFVSVSRSLPIGRGARLRCPPALGDGRPRGQATQISTTAATVADALLKRISRSATRTMVFITQAYPRMATSQNLQIKVVTNTRHPVRHKGTPTTTPCSSAYRVGGQAGRIRKVTYGCPKEWRVVNEAHYSPSRA